MIGISRSHRRAAVIHRLHTAAMLLAVALLIVAKYVTPDTSPFAVWGVSTVHAAVGIYHPITYQGKITLTSGTVPTNGTYNFRFKVFTGATLGSPIWTETWDSANQVTMTGGLFSVRLGSLTAMTGVDFNSDNLYLQVEFDPANAGTYPEVFAPRRRFTSVPYALNADKLDGLDSTQFLRSDTGSTITGGALHILSAGTSLTVSGTASGDVLHAQRLLTTSGALVVKGNAVFDATTLFVDSTTHRVGIGTSAPETALEVIGTGSGSRFFATNSLSTSGTLVVQGAAVFRSTATLNGVTYTFPYGDGSASGKVLKTNGTGQLSWSTDQTGGGGSTFGSGNVLTIGDGRYVNAAGDTMTGGLLIQNGTLHGALPSADAGVLLEVAGTMSGRVLHAQDRIESSGSVVLSGTNLTNPLVRLSNSGANTAILFQSRTGASSPGPNSPGTGADDSGTGTVAWSSPGNILASDNSYAAASLNTGDVTHYLKATNFGFNIPSNATILGIRVEWEKSIGPANTALDKAVRIVKGGTIGTTDRSSGINWPTSDAYIVYGSASDLWGQTWTPADINASTFGSALSVACVLCSLTTANLDHVRITVTYGQTVNWSQGVDYADGKKFKISASSALGTRDLLVLTSTGSVGIGTASPGSRLSLSGAMLINPNGSIGSAAADAGLALEVIGTASGRTLIATDAITGSGTFTLKKKAGTGTGNILVVDTKGLVYDASNKRVGIGTAAPETALEVIGTASGDILHAQKMLNSSGVLVVAGTSTFESGAVIQRAQRSEFLRLRDTTNSRSVGVLAGSGSPVTRVTAGTGSLYIDDYKGRLYLKVKGTGSGAGWEQVLTGSGNALDMAKMYRNAAQSISAITTTKINYDSVEFDVGGITSTANSKITIKKAGKYLVTAYQVCPAVSGNKICDQYVYKNGASVLLFQEASPLGVGVGVGASTVLDLAVGDSIEGYMYQDTGGAINTQTAVDLRPFLSVVQLNIAAGADLAETYYSADASIAPGDVLSLDPASEASVRKSVGAHDMGVLGIVSTQPGLVLGDASPRGEEKPVLVALAGRVPVKVTTENGPIAAGDLLGPSSMPGVAMKAAPGSVVIGQSLTPYNGAGVGQAIAFVKNAPPSTQGLLDFRLDSRATLRLGGSLSLSGSLVVAGGAHFGSGVVVASQTTASSATLLSLRSDVGGAGNTVFRVQADGNIYSDGNFTGNGADFAEWFYAADQDLKPGEAACIDVTKQNTVARCRRSGDPNVMGIVSTHPAFIGNRFAGAEGLPVPGTVLVGLIGQVPATAVVEGSGGAIRPGDQLTTASVPGLVRKARPGESTLGVALEELASGRGRIQVLISRRNQSLTVDMVEETTLQAIRDMKVEDQVSALVADAEKSLSASGSVIDAALNAQLGKLDITQKIREVLREMSGSLLASQTQTVAAPTGSSATMDVRDTLRVGGATTLSGTVKAGGTLTADALVSEKTLLVAGDTSIGGDLYLGGMLKVSSLFVPGIMKVDGGLQVGSLAAGSGTVKSLAVERLTAGSGSRVKGTLVIDGRLELGSGAVLAFGSGSAVDLSSVTVRSALHVLGDVTVTGLASFLGDVRIAGQLTVSDRQAGITTVAQGGTGVLVRFEPSLSAAPVITVTPHGRTGGEWWTDAESETGFTIRVDHPLARSVAFSWTALLAEGAPLPASSSAFSSSSSASGSSLPSFPVDEHGVPLTGNAIEDTCLRNQTPLDPDGHPYTCNRYHVEHVWQFGALSFEWNTLVDPPRLTPPAGYVVVTQGAASSAASQDTGSGSGAMTGSGWALSSQDGAGSGTTAMRGGVPPAFTAPVSGSDSGKVPGTDSAAASVASPVFSASSDLDGFASSSGGTLTEPDTSGSAPADPGPSTPIPTPHE